MRYTLLLCFFPLFLNAQLLMKTVKPSRFSIELQAGKVNSKERVIYAWFCDFCPQFEEKNIAVNTDYASLMANYRIDARQQFGIGYAKTQHGYEYVSQWSYNQPVLMNYHTLKLRHRITLLHGNYFSFSIANSLDLERKGKANDDFWINESVHINKYGLSHLAEFTFGVAIGRNFKINFSPSIRTAISKYSEFAFNGKQFRRYGYGSLLGLEYGFGQSLSNS